MNAEKIKQDRASKLVEQEVYCHVGGLIRQIEDNNPDWLFENFLEDYFPADEDIRDRMIENGVKYAPDIEEMDDARDSDEYQEAVEQLVSELEIYEYWAVSSWLADKLREHGQIVKEFGLTHVWGRPTTGQAIMLDYVINQIVNETGYAEWLANEKE